MLSQERNTSRSPSESAQTDSVRNGPINRLTTQQSQRSSITEEDEDDNVPRAPPIPTSFRASAKSSSSSSTASTPIRPTPKPASSGVSASKVINAIAFQRPPAQKTNSAQRNPNQTTTPSESKRTIQGLFGRVSARDIEDEQPTAISTSQYRHGKGNQSTFEKIDSHTGGTTYLGSGSFGCLEDCIRNYCLSHNKYDLDFTNYNRKHDYSYRCLTRASILDDYSYDGIISPRCNISIPLSTDHCYSSYKKHASDLPLDEIRHINDELAKYGIPVFSNPAHPYRKPHSVGDVLSVCQQLLADQAHRSPGGGQSAVQHVWDNLHYHSPQTNMYGYAPPALRSVASHLFNPSNQPPYNPTQSAVSHLFGNPQQNPYNPGQGAPPPPPGPYGYPQQNPSGGGGQSAISRLFGNPQPNSYNPGQGAPPPPPPPPPYGNNPQQGSGGAGQSVLARLFSGQG